MTTLAESLALAGKALLDAADAVSASAPGGPTRPQEAPQATPEPLPFSDTPQARSAEGGCVIHDAPWVIRPAGTSKKTGEPYRAFWHCNEQNDDGSFCREKPSPAWVKAHPPA
jgi:hypothetical protein